MGGRERTAWTALGGLVGSTLVGLLALLFALLRGC